MAAKKSRSHVANLNQKYISENLEKFTSNLMKGYSHGINSQKR